MAKDWRKLAEANGLTAPEGILGTLDNLEREFRPLVERLGPEDDMAADYLPEPAR